MKKLIIILIAIMLSSCSLKVDTDSIDKTIESSKALGNVNMVNDITKPGQNQNQNNKEEINDVKLGVDEQQLMDEDKQQKNAINTSKPKLSPTMKSNTQDRETTTLQVEDIQIGTGVEATSGKQVAVHYVGKLVNGKEFDNSYKRGDPITFTLGSGQVIKGWDIGIEGMKVGGQRHLLIPPDLAYGDNPRDPSVIPPGSTLIFDVQLVDVR